MTRSRRALVLGANGQDGSYLVDHLLAAGWSVVGVGRQDALRMPAATEINYRYVQLDLADQHRVLGLLMEVSPDYVFHAAAIHGMAGFIYEDVWDKVLQVNAVSVLAVLEYLRGNSDCGFSYISSSKVFGPIEGRVIDEMSPRHSSCLYTISKNTSHDLIAYYRKRHGVKASVVWTFNHESPRRGAEYFIPRLARALLNAESDRSYHTGFDRLGFWGNWGAASEYMQILVDLADRQIFDDFILASPRTIWAQDFVEELFAAHGLDWRNHIHLKTPDDGVKPSPYSINLSKLQQLNVAVPIQHARGVIEEIIESMRAKDRSTN
jgi:GDPmannose 4,6-dehydratase